MTSRNRITKQLRAGTAPPKAVLRGAAALLLAAFVGGTAHAQTILNQPTTRTLFAGTADWNAFGLASLTTPSSGLILAGTAISTFTGKPVRHIWYGDASNGLCRIDPEIDAPAPATLPPGIGNWQGVQRTCVGTIQAAGFVPGQLAFDAAHNTIFAADTTATSKGIIRLVYIPSGDSGQGALDPIHVTALMGSQTGRNAAGGCPPVGDPNVSGNPIGVQPDAAAVGPDGNLYIGYKRGGLIVRILNPSTMTPDPDGNGNAGPVCKANTQVPLVSPQERLGGAGHTFGLGWIGHTLYGGDNIAPWTLPNGDQCLTPANGNKLCGPLSSTEILAAFVAGPQGGTISDATYPTFAGNALFFATLGQVTRVTNVGSGQIANMNLATQFGGTFCSVSGLIVDTTDLANETLYVGEDCTGGGINGAGTIWQIKPAPPAPGPPLPPVTVTAAGATPVGANGPGAGQETVSWVPISNGQPITSFTVQTLNGDGTASSVPPVTVTATAPSTVVPTSVVVTGLTLGASYEFEVSASNGATSAFSAPSNVVTPQAPTVPGQVTNVVASSGNALASVAWTAPASDGGSAITGYTITGTGGVSQTVSGNVTGAIVGGLTNGLSYSFTVHATNAVGNGLESASSNIVVPIVVNAADMSITMSAPATINAGSLVTFTMIVTNKGPGDVGSVTLTDTLPATTTFSSTNTSQGTCSSAGSTFTCTLGFMPAGGTATVGLTVTIGTANVTNTANVSGFVAGGGASVNDPVPGNNVASATTTVSSGAPLVTADIQVGGSAQNGGPAVGTADTYTWQIKNNTGNVAAPNVTFTATYPSTFTAISANGPSCNEKVNATDHSTKVTCTTASLAGGQAMTVIVAATVPTVAGSYPVTGSATFGGTDSNAANNSFTVTIQAK